MPLWLLILYNLATRMANSSERALPPMDLSGSASKVAERWRQWKRSHEHYIEGKGITQAGRRKSQLLHLAGLEVQDIYGGEYWTKMELNKFISNRVMHYIVPCGDIPSKTTNFSVDRYTIPDTSCYCIGHAPTSYRMLLYRAWCCQIVINVRR